MEVCLHIRTKQGPQTASRIRKKEICGEDNSRRPKTPGAPEVGMGHSCRVLGMRTSVLVLTKWTTPDSRGLTIADKPFDLL